MRVHRFAIATLCVTFLLLLVGGLVHATGSSLACPDWPLCYGQVFPKMEGGVLVEHSHRLLASAVGLMTIALAVMLFRQRPPNPRTMRLGLIAVALVCVQGVLGGITVLLRLPLLISTAHLAMSMLFFSLLLLIVWETRPGRPTTTRSRKLAELSGVATAGALAVYAQIVLGAFVRHTGAGLACNTTILKCNGALWPSGAESGPAHVHMAHRLAAILLGVFVTWIAARVARQAQEDSRPGLRRLAWSGPMLVGVQIALGILTVKSFISVPVVQSHLGVGALLLAQQVALALACRRERENSLESLNSARPSVATPLASKLEPQS